MFWPLLLIALGLVFLLSNLGFISGVSWLAVANLWPLLLVLIGLDIAFAQRWPVATLAAEVLVIGAGLAVMAYAPSLTGGLITFHVGGGGSGVSEAGVPRLGANSLSLRLNGGAARSYRVSGGASNLVEARSANRDLRLTQSRSQTAPSGAERVDVRIDQVSTDGGVFRASPAEITVQVASDVPATLDINIGAGEFDVDLSEIAVTDARLNIGASSVRLVLPKPTGDVAVRLNGGASSLTVTVPNGVEARISTSGGLLSLRSDNPRLGTGGGTGGCLACGSSVETTGYAAAADRVTVTITAGASSIVVR
jgi:hypothetical protein